MLNGKMIIGISTGDPASVGPEISIKALLDKEVYTLCNPLLIGDFNLIKKVAGSLNINIKFNRIKNVEDAEFEYGIIDVFDLENVQIDKLRIGEISAMAGNAAFENVIKVIELAKNHKIDATVTGPINKAAINLAGHKFSGHTEIYAHYTNTKKYAMLLVEDNLRIIHVSTHVSLRHACDLVKKERILNTIELIDDACRRLGVLNPKLGVAALNPHAGEGGLFGWEEKEEIVPAIKEAVQRGFRVDGPIPADTLFPKAIGGLYDGVVAMYHDQGHIPFKVVGFNWDQAQSKMKSVKGVNITLGLPIIRTSVDHGTAMEIAGKGIASAEAMILSIKYAVQLANKKDISN